MVNLHPAPKFMKKEVSQSLDRSPNPNLPRRLKNPQLLQWQGRFVYLHLSSGLTNEVLPQVVNLCLAPASTIEELSQLLERTVKSRPAPKQIRGDIPESQEAMVNLRLQAPQWTNKDQQP
mmetsp:Transcript_25289/g.46301  ORF Transcript_25289/g.46301 Transcript_25289/m.46301 type:complete len:120 (+) Transcript_25289:604-963(+)